MHRMHVQHFAAMQNEAVEEMTKVNDQLCHSRRGIDCHCRLFCLLALKSDGGDVTLSNLIKLRNFTSPKRT